MKTITLAVLAALLIFSIPASAMTGDPGGVRDMEVEQEASRCADDPACSRLAARRIAENPPRKQGWGDYLLVGAFVVGAGWFFSRDRRK